MYSTQNGWTKETMIAHIKTNFKGKSRDDCRCLYRGPEGRKCAAGLFIKDEDYEPYMEGKTIGRVANNSSKISDSLPLAQDGMSQLQMIHDRSDHESTLEDLLKWVESFVL